MAEDSESAASQQSLELDDQDTCGIDGDNEEETEHAKGGRDRAGTARARGSRSGAGSQDWGPLGRSRRGAHGEDSVRGGWGPRGNGRRDCHLPRAPGRPRPSPLAAWPRRRVLPRPRVALMGAEEKRAALPFEVALLCPLPSLLSPFRLPLRSRHLKRMGKRAPGELRKGSWARPLLGTPGFAPSRVSLELFRAGPTP
ncbi:hypothetical protein P7K49_014832 [Saguinus oedipus]|uniref:Uncharacterized protein n=1 Tax=Saguinus oedipus TaxID=9490 RepID=A0ABQ9V7I2_SAGOE|nr:hypothetical protein P7K49_014832 [Saguinus oedipus]